MPNCIVESTRSFFCNTDNHFAKLIKNSDGQDKLLKFASEGLFPLITEIAKEAGASESTMNGLSTAHTGVKITRDVTGALNFFRSTIPICVEKVKQTGALLTGLFRNEEVPLADPRETRVRNPASVTVDGDDVDSITEFRWTPALKHNQIAMDRGEMLLKLGENAGGLIGGLTYGLGFGFAKPAANIRKYFGVQYGDFGNGLAEAFPYLMCANHIGGAIQSSFDLGYQFRAHARAANDLNYDFADVQKDFEKAVIDDGIVLTEKLLELISDACGFLRNVTPVGLRIALGLTINGLALYRVWRKTA